MTEVSILATGTTGTVGSVFPRYVKPLPIRVAPGTDYAFGAHGLRNVSLIHAAGVVGSRNIKSNPFARYVNVEGTIEFARQALESGVHRFVYVSSSHVYGNSGGLISEDRVPKPLTEYGRQKLDAEIGLMGLFSQNPEKLKIVRVFSLLDTGMPAYSLGGLADRLLAGSCERVACALDERDFLDRSTIAVTLAMIASQTVLPGEVFNLCSSKPLSVKNALSRYVEELGAPQLKLEFEEENSDMPSLVGDNTRLVNSLKGADLTWNINRWSALASQNQIRTTEIEVGN